jgi:AraC family transcriptional regulator of adaptative response/methylated-DNA-[protein]-cysteine methyltransferase
MTTRSHPTVVANEDLLWRQLQQRDTAACFVYAVVTTGVFCRPGCASRLPLRQNVRFFAHPAAASAAGFRPCQRCRPEQSASTHLVEQVCGLLHRHHAQGTAGPLPLARLAQETGRSPYTIQRAFQSALGVSPAQFLRRLRAQSFARELAHSGQSITEAIYAAGYSSSSRAYSGSPLGLTPGSLRRGGAAEPMEYAMERCDFGQESAFIPGYALAARTQRGLCWLAFGDLPEALLDDLRRQMHAATLVRSATLGTTLRSILDAAHAGRALPSLPLDLRGTAFQLRVWSLLQKIPAGETRSYHQLAQELGQPKATRAVARACATNSVALLVPCHRVVAASGKLSGYRWGTERKRALIAAEKSGN